MSLLLLLLLLELLLLSLLELLFVVVVEVGLILVVFLLLESFFAPAFKLMAFRWSLSDSKSSTLQDTSQYSGRY